jgi:hypothetical protein
MVLISSAMTETSSLEHFAVIRSKRSWAFGYLKTAGGGGGGDAEDDADCCCSELLVTLLNKRALLPGTPQEDDTSSTVLFLQSERCNEDIVDKGSLRRSLERQWRLRRRFELCMARQKECERVLQKVLE